MGDFTPSIPIAIQIRKIIFEKFNDPETRFTNDEIFEILKQNGDLDPNWIIDDTEPFFQEICDKEMVRNIAQNFTTMWFKLFESVEKLHCNACNNDVCLASNEEKVCPDPSCKSTL